ncbi:MAG: ABC transporter ATP-binding protein [Eubacteriales bacterium]|nr:ABC transporter ATP-binding protein [Eubacteriales bacterium]
MIDIQKLTFSYTKQPFIEDMSFSVGDGEIFGFLGPSGAGKSTIQKILIGMLPRYGGSVTVNGTEARNAGSAFYEQIGVDFEYPTLYEKLTARQNLRFFSSLYASKKLDIDALLASVGLLKDGDKKVSDYSKGMRSRLGFIKALIHNPILLFLDEPTSGLDPNNARIMKDCILAQKAKGVTVVLTTHNMEDAAELCDKVAFIVDGKVQALDQPHKLIMQRGAARLRYTWMEKNREQSGFCAMEQTAHDEQLQKLIAENRLTSIHSSEPTLGDIFMDVTGRKLQ